MRGSLDARLTRYAAAATVHAVLVLVAFTGALGDAYAVVLVAASLPLLFAPGAFMADLTLNADVDAIDLNRWRVLLWVLPWSMVVYWVRFVRPRGRDDGC